MFDTSVNSEQSVNSTKADDIINTEEKDEIKGTNHGGGMAVRTVEGSWMKLKQDFFFLNSGCVEQRTYHRP